jgi:hypothetical protein
LTISSPTIFPAGTTFQIVPLFPDDYGSAAALTYQWEFRVHEATSFSVIPGATEMNLTIFNFTSENSGLYLLRVTNGIDALYSNTVETYAVPQSINMTINGSTSNFSGTGFFLYADYVPPIRYVGLTGAVYLYNTIFYSFVEADFEYGSFNDGFGITSTSQGSFSIKMGRGSAMVQSNSILTTYLPGSA